MIYIKEEDVSITRTRKNFIRKFLRGLTIPSYLDESCTILQCDGRGEDAAKTAYRSITDLHQIVLSRFPKTSLEAIVKIIYEIMQEDHTIILVWCNRIQKVVVKYVPNKSAKWASNYSIENHYTRKGEDGYSIKDYEKIKNSLKI